MTGTGIIALRNDNPGNIEVKQGEEDGNYVPQEAPESPAFELKEKANDLFKAK